MAWQQLRVQVRPDQIEPLEQLLLDYGGLSISYLDAEDQPVFQKEPGSTPLWDRVDLVCLFEEATNLDGLLFLLQQHPAIEDKQSLTLETLEDQAWERSWMSDFKAMQFGERLWVCPSWQEPPEPSAINIMLDPGLAFGSGSHATTSLCLQWLEQNTRNDSTVIDYGCGSGILAIAAALLGAPRVIAVDNDPQAITATIENAKRNHIPEGVIETYLPEQLPSDRTSHQADILVANILAEPLMQLAENLSDLVKPKGHIVLSGLLAEQADAVLKHYSPWFEMDEAVLSEEWARLSGTLLD
ncbi:MAG: 50S ribosomal protein L11 methyltransferase [SAR86 cluster bacterium]|uniref:Ribosomal protein L11 methyltransferase n=1 Tax=SAR86 cluster bacterium TaxID=2030880 RepID=A0A2A4X453_9GAMM|nr:MAG: 50S ribosomal protein L11 methyltransferase [SAR86 cluster bacterium]